MTSAGEQVGIVFEWQPFDGVGRIRLESGEVLRVGQSAFGNEHPEVGARCVILTTAPHPLGGSRVTRAQILELPPPAPPPPSLPEGVRTLQAVMRRHHGSVKDFDRWLAGMPPVSDHAGWLRERIARSTLFGFQGAARMPRGIEQELAWLEEALEMLRGLRPLAPVHELDFAVVPAGERAELRHLVEAQLRAWHGVLTEPLDQLRLHRIGQRLGLPALAMTAPPELRCQPFGTTEGLDAAWVRRISRWSEAARGGRPLALERFALDGAKVAFGRPDRASIEYGALDYELRRPDAFPRELAAMLCVADGVSVDDVPLLAPIARWTWNDDGLEIGAGSTAQGTLTLVARKGDLLGCRVLDRDDDGSVLHDFASLAAWFDAVLGSAPRSPETTR